jgi:hypothetical protein
VIVPSVDAPEAALVTGVDVIPVFSLAQLVNDYRGHKIIPPFIPSERTFHLNRFLRPTLPW